MLQQILNDLWVDPELLSRLDEDQKQQLFCHMREEQVRRWKLWDDEQLKLEAAQKVNPKSATNTSGKKKKKQVQFKVGEDGEPWVWVMGDHPDDKSIEQILEEEARLKALDLAKIEAEQLRKKLEAGLLLSDDSWEDTKTEKSDVLDIYNTTDEIKQAFIKSPANNRKHPVENNNREVLQELKFNKKPTGVASRVAQWEHRLMEERSTEIFQTLQKKKQELVHEAEKDGQKQEELWLEQERKAKEAEQQIREIARRAREEHRRSAVLMESTSPPPSPLRNQPSSPINNDPTANNYSNPSTIERADPARPPNKEAIFEWFQNTEKIRRAGIDPTTNQTAPWFHGLISRQEAETLLKDEEVGAFLVRVSEKIWGYAISLKEEGRCKHYLVEANNGHYQFPGQNQMTHKTLAELVSYHSWEPITAVGKELLRKPCAWTTAPEIIRP